MKSSMSAQPIGLLHRLRSAFNILSAIRAGEFSNPANDISLHMRLLKVAEDHFPGMSSSTPSGCLISAADKQLRRLLFSMRTATKWSAWTWKFQRSG